MSGGEDIIIQLISPRRHNASSILYKNIARRKGTLPETYDRLSYLLPKIDHLFRSEQKLVKVEPDILKDIIEGATCTLRQGLGPNFQWQTIRLRDLRREGLESPNALLNICTQVNVRAERPQNILPRLRDRVGE